MENARLRDVIAVFREMAFGTRRAAVYACSSAYARFSLFPPFPPSASLFPLFYSTFDTSRRGYIREG